MGSRSFRTDLNASEAGRTFRNCISEKVLGKKEGEKVKENDERRKSFVSGVQVFVFSPVAGTSHESHWEKQVDNKPYSSLRGITIDSLDRGSDSSSGGPAGGTDGIQACLERERTHFGQKRLPQSEQTCQKPGLPPPHAEPRHLALLEFFMGERKTA